MGHKVQNLSIAVAFAAVCSAQSSVKVQQITCPQLPGLPTAMLPMALPQNSAVVNGPPPARLECFALDPASFIIDTSQNPPVLRIVVTAQAQQFVDDEVPAGAIDGTNKTFTLANVPASGSLKLYFNGIKQKLGLDYTLTGRTIVFITAVFPAVAQDVLTADYRR